VVGKGALGSTHFKIQAEGTGTGTGATGTYSTRDGKVFTKYSVSCLDVGGSNAWVGLTVTDSNSFTPGDEFVYLFSDNIFDGQDGISAFGGISAANCGADPSPDGASPVTRGGFTVTDGAL
jgi:hypothetical protein